ncbi:unnamed protein product [marine sediment metagenome]|uniref:Uncharacterized protein n=1 Tax=marine sediment metagenome TaxID=412755 RepID=X0ZY00_9ZZZZ
MPRKRTKREALERLSSVNLVPDVSDINSPRLQALAAQLQVIEDGAKLGAAGLVLLDPLNRLADQVTVIPYPMIAIPAHEAYRLNSNPSFQIYIRGGETIMPTGGNVRDVQEVVTESADSSMVTNTPKPRRKSKYHAAYGKAFKELAPKYKLKSGKWAKNGFKRTAAAARKQAKGMK